MRTTLDTMAQLLGATALIAVLVVGSSPVRPAHAAAPLGACCLHGGGCQNLIESQCDDISGEFIGADTACATADCLAQVGAPLLSIFGLVAATGALGGLGVYRLLFRQRRA